MIKRTKLIEVRWWRGEQENEAYGSAVVERWWRGDQENEADRSAVVETRPADSR